jgi:hypothetical protein
MAHAARAAFLATLRIVHPIFPSESESEEDSSESDDTE